MIAYVIGDKDMITGFRLVGVEGIEVSTTEDAQHALRRAVARSDIGIIIINETFLSEPAIRDEVDKIRQERVTPLIVEVPASNGQSNRMQLSEMISRILGIKI
jgi:V/A-type H+-transporting ATPase subunit F